LPARFVVVPRAIHAELSQQPRITIARRRFRAPRVRASRTNTRA